MPILPENFVANVLSGTILVTDGFANLNLATNPYALEGDKSFVIKIRKGGIDGLVIASSPTITLKDNSEFVSLTANVSTVAEGNLVSFTLVTANAADNANVYYSILPVTANVNAQDFVGANIGKATIFNNQAVFSYFANADYSLVDETGETFKVQLRTNSPTGNIVYTTSNVAITDFYKTINVFRFEESASGIAEGSSVTFTVYAHNVTPGSLLYYYTSGNADISGSNTGSVVMNGVSNTITLTTASTVPGNQTRNFALVLSGSNLGAPIATSNTISVADLALTSITATGGTVSLSGGYKIHQFTTSGNLTITGTSPLTQMEYLAIAGGGGGGGGPSDAYGGGGGGAGGVLLGTLPAGSAGNITVVVGAGGNGGPGGPSPGYGNAGSDGGNTTVNLNLIAFGGGGGAAAIISDGRPGGSGGGSAFAPAVRGSNVIGQGNPGGAGINASGGRGGTGGGGGYSSAGGDAAIFPPGQDNTGYSGMGGLGLLSNYSGTNKEYAGGGGGGAGYGSPPFAANVGRYGGGNGGAAETSGIAANVNTGGGGGGAGRGTFSPGPIRYTGGAGASGIVIIRYPWQPLPFYTSVTANASAVIEGSNAFFVINTTFANASTLFYDTVGNVTSSNFVNGNTGSFVVTSNATVLRLETIANIPTDETRDFQLRIREDSVTGNIVLISDSVIIADSNVQLYLTASGGTTLTANGYRTHIFTTSGTFAVSSTGVLNSVEYFIVAGGGGGMGRYTPAGAGGGGGAGGVLFGTTTVQNSPYTITVGAGGAGGGGSPAPGEDQFLYGANGNPSSALSLTSFGGGRGGGGAPGSPINTRIGTPGGSGGGTHLISGGSTTPGGSGYGFPGTIGSTMQGYPGGSGSLASPAGFGPGGGGAGGVGGGGGNQAGTRGGVGIGSPISPTIPAAYGTGGPNSQLRYFAGGGAGQQNADTTSSINTSPVYGGGGGSQSVNGAVQPLSFLSGNVNTGGGGGSTNSKTPVPATGSGGSGIVIIRYPYI